MIKVAHPEMLPALMTNGFTIPIPKYGSWLMEQLFKRAGLDTMFNSDGTARGGRTYVACQGLLFALPNAEGELDEEQCNA